MAGGLFIPIFKNCAGANGGEVKRMKVKCIKRYSDICLKEIVEKGTVLEVTESRGEHLISEGVAEAVREAKAAAKGKE
jgi:hypothetical protein|nr:MAG TPA: hypothetical protein [Caudoviricetes sp.]DAT65648.1 MAG TPA: hypothetical protein [Caudoviricetes sp.]